MPVLPPFVWIAPNKDDISMGSGFVLSSVHPFYLGRVIKLQRHDFAIINFKAEFNPLILAEIEGYSIAIAFAGNLSGYRVQVSGIDWETELQNLFNKMADWFYDEKIARNAGYYRRYQLS